MIKNNFHYVSVLLEQLYGMEMDDEDIEELGLLAWQHIGNKDVKLYRCLMLIDPTDNSITLPCNAGGNSGDIKVEAVTTTFEDWNHVTNRHDFGDHNSAYVENAIESEKWFQSPYYLPGKMLKYEQVKDKLYFTHNYGKVNVLYKGILVDEEGLPELTDKEAAAIATYIAYVNKFKESLITINPNISKQAELLYALWSKQCDLARVTYLSQNDMNNIIDIKGSWDRANYNLGGYKPIR